MVFISSKKLEYVNVGIQLQLKQDNNKFHFDFFYLQFKDLKYFLINQILNLQTVNKGNQNETSCYLVSKKLFLFLRY